MASAVICARLGLCCACDLLQVVEVEAAASSW